MIDLHCHILPGVDDGAANMADTVAMARGAAADGIETICATPHIRHDHDVRIPEIPERVREVNDALAREGVPVEVVTGGEVAETSVAGLSDDELRAVTLGAGGRWILLEPAPGSLSESLNRTVAELAQRGFSSLVAHPERHLTPDLGGVLARLVREGALVQATADALVDERSAPSMAELAERGLIHVVGSDSHSARFGRPVSLSSALAVLRGVEPTAAHADWIALRAPAAIVAGEPLAPPFEPR